MKKLLSILILFFALSSQAQYQGFWMNGQYTRVKVDTTLHIPTFCGVPTLRGSTATNQSAIGFDTCSHVVYLFDPPSQSWIPILGGGSGGSRIDSITVVDSVVCIWQLGTSLCANLKRGVLSIVKVADTVITTLQDGTVFKFSTGVQSVTGSGITVDNTDPANPIIHAPGIPNLEQVTNAGVTTTHAIISTNNGRIATDNGTDVAQLDIGSLILKTLGSTYGTIKATNLNTVDKVFQLPNFQFGTTGTFPMSVNGVPADNTGNIIVATVDTFLLLHKNDSTLANRITANTNAILTKINISDSAAMLLPYLRKNDSTLANRITSNTIAIASKQPQINGTGFVKASGTTISYDNATYLTSIDTSNITNFSVKVKSLISATAPIVYNNGTGGLTITQASTSTNGYLNSTDWNTFNNKQATISGTANRITLSSNILDISSTFEGLLVHKSGVESISGVKTFSALTNFSKDADGPMQTLFNGDRANFLEFSRTGYLPKVTFGALGGIEANVSYNMDYSDGVHRFYDVSRNATWEALNAGGYYIQFAPHGAVADIWTNSGSQYLFTALAAGNAVVSNGLTVGANLIKDSTTTNVIGGNGNLMVGTTSDQRYKVYIVGIDVNGSLLAESAFGGVLSGKLTTASAVLGDNTCQLNGWNGSTKTSVIKMIGGGATDAGAIDFYTKAAGGSLTQALRINTDQTVTFQAAITAPKNTISSTNTSANVINRSSGTANITTEWQQGTVAKAFVGLSGAAGLITGMGDGDFGIRAQSKAIYFSTDAGVTSALNIAATTGAVTFSKAFATAYIAKAVDYTATSSDHSIEVTVTGKTITLPTAVGVSGREYIIKLTVSGSSTVATTSSQTIDGSTTYSLSAQYKYVTVQSNNANWIIIANN